MKTILLIILIIVLLNQRTLGQFCEECLKKNDDNETLMNIKSIAEMPTSVIWEDATVENIEIYTCISGQRCVLRKAFYITYGGFNYWVARQLNQSKDIDAQCRVYDSIVDSVYGIGNTFSWDNKFYLPSDKMEKYNPEDFMDLVSSKNYDPFYLTYLLPTSLVESKYFFASLINYDCTGVTFGFVQFAAHTQNYNFVLLLKGFIKEYPEIAKKYFKDLIVLDDRIHRVINENTNEVLENNTSTEGLENYFKPNYNYISDSEILNAAKLMHLSQFRKEFRENQVLLAKKIIIDDLLNTYAHSELGILLNNLPDYMLILITDRYHQIGAKKKTREFKNIITKYFVESTDGYNIENIKEDVIDKLYGTKYEGRANDILKYIKKLIEEKKLGVKKYNYDSKSFESIE